MLSLVSAVLLLAQAGDQPAPQPWTEEQLARLRQLVRTTQEKSSELQTQLTEKQRALADVYAQYELNERRAQRLQQEIVDLQKQLLANHHAMQVELRAIVGKDRFDVLRQRLSRVIGPTGTKPLDSEPPKR